VIIRETRAARHMQNRTVSCADAGEDTSARPAIPIPPSTRRRVSPRWLQFANPSIRCSLSCGPSRYLQKLIRRGRLYDRRLHQVLSL